MAPVFWAECWTGRVPISTRVGGHYLRSDFKKIPETIIVGIALRIQTGLVIVRTTRTGELGNSQALLECSEPLASVVWKSVLAID